MANSVAQTATQDVLLRLSPKQYEILLNYFEGASYNNELSDAQEAMYRELVAQGMGRGLRKRRGWWELPGEKHDPKRLAANAAIDDLYAQAKRKVGNG